MGSADSHGDPYLDRVSRDGTTRAGGVPRPIHPVALALIGAGCVGVGMGLALWACLAFIERLLTVCGV